jgi:hypothetical protein
MFQIRINGQRLDLYAAQTIVLERYNPLFDFDVVRGAKVLDYTVPFSRTNDKIFGHARLPQAPITDEVFFCEKYDGSELLERGYVYLLGVLSNGYSISYSQNLGEIFGDYQRIPLNQIDFGSEAVPGIIPAVADHLTAAYCFPTVLNSGFYGTTLPIGFSGRMNEYSGSAYVGTQTLVPMFFLGWLLRQIETLCGFSIRGEFVDDAAMQRLVWPNTFSLDSLSTITYQNHLPEITIPDLLKELRKLFNLALFFDVRNRTLTINYADGLLNQEPLLNWSSKFAPAANRAPEVARRLELDWEPDSGDGRMKVRPTDYELYQSPGDTPLFPVKTRLSTLEKDVSTGLPLMEQPGITPTNNQMNNKFSPRLLFWHGLVAGQPTALPDYGSYRLAWHGTNNLVERFWKDYEQFRKKTTRRLLYANLNASDIAHIDHHRTVGQNMKIHVQGTNYLIGSQRIALPLNTLTELELLSV